MLDHVLFAKLGPKCKNLRADQCVTAAPVSEPCTDVEAYDSQCCYGLQFFHKMIQLRTKGDISMIPQLEYVWKKNSVFYVKSATTSGMCTLADYAMAITRPMLINILLDFFLTLHAIHQEGVHHGLIHETAIVIDTKHPHRRAFLVGFSDRHTLTDNNFPVQRERDLRAVAAMLCRLMLITRIDLSRICAIINAPNISSVTLVISELRAILWSDTAYMDKYISRWQEMLGHTMVATLTSIEIGTVYGTMHERLAHVLAEFDEHVLCREHVMPVFVNMNIVARGKSTWIPIIHDIFDCLIDQQYLVVHKGMAGLIPNSEKNLSLSICQVAYAFIGYLIAYMFFMNIPMNCLLSRIVVQIVMNTTGQSDPLTVGIVCSHTERQLIAPIKPYLCYMRTGAARLASMMIYKTFNMCASRLYDWHYNIEQANVSIGQLPVDCFHFDTCMTQHERSVVIEWTRALPPIDACMATHLITNHRVVTVHAAAIRFGKSTNQELSISTCVSQILFPSTWLQNVETLYKQMYIQLAPYMDFGNTNMDVDFNKI